MRVCNNLLIIFASTKQKNMGHNTMGSRSSLSDPFVGQPFKLLEKSILFLTLQNIVCSCNTPFATTIVWIYYLPLNFDFPFSSACCYWHRMYILNLHEPFSEKLFLPKL